MDHARRQPSHRGKLFSACDRSVRFDPISHFFAYGDHVANFAGVVGPHRDLADDPVPDVAFRRGGFLFDAFDLTALEYAFKLFFQHVARLTCEHLENVLAEH